MQVDIIKYVSIPILKKFIVDDDVDLKVSSNSSIKLFEEPLVTLKGRFHVRLTKHL